MAEVLSQEEIDRLLTPINQEVSEDFAERIFVSVYENIETFEKYLIDRKFTPEEPYGFFDKDISICRYFGSGESENILEDIKRRNEEQGYGNIKIPNTNITLINYSFCGKCKTIFSFKDIIDYYINPKPDQRFRNRPHQYREDTRVYCKHCGSYFLPSLIISDETPKNEVQFLCRTQTVDAVEKYLLKKNIQALTKKKENIIQKGNLRAIKNDVFIRDLEEKPTLITNIIQYTPIKYIKNFIDSTNVQKGDLLFNEWKDN